jgi:hypothetical protein
MTVVVTVTKAQVIADAKLQAPDNLICEEKKGENSLVLPSNIPLYRWGRGNFAGIPGMFSLLHFFVDFISAKDVSVRGGKERGTSI